MKRLTPYVLSFVQTPRRMWRWSLAHPYESITYGTAMLVISLWAQPLIAIAAASAIAGGLYQTVIKGKLL